MEPGKISIIKKTPDPGAVEEHLKKKWPDDIPSGHVLPCIAMKGSFNDAGKWVVGVAAIEFCQTTAEAVAWLVSKDSTGHDVYATLSTIKKERADQLVAAGKKQRGTSSDAACVAGFYLDLDVGEGKFPSKEIAMWFANNALPIRPTLLAGSGNGVHAEYFFREPEYIDNPSMRASLEARIHGFSLLAKNAAQKHGCKIDAVWDLARIDRIPGTWNKKGGQLREVSLLSAWGSKINPSDLDDYAVAPTKATAGENNALEKMGPVFVDANAYEFPQRKFDALCVAEPKFKSSWNHKRKDLQDTSNSGYDMSLATFTAQAGWEPQEIINLLIAHRQRWSDSAAESQRRDPVRLKRPQYYIETVAKAFAKIEEAREEEKKYEGEAKLTELLPKPGREPKASVAAQPASKDDDDAGGIDAVGDEVESEEKQIALDFMYDQLRIRIHSVTSYGDKSGVIYIVNDKIQFNGDAEFQNWNRWRMAAIAGGFVPRVKKPREWELVVACIYRLVMSREKGSSDIEALHEFLTSLWESAVADQVVNSGEGEEIVRRRGFALTQWGWYRDRDELVINEARFSGQYRQEGAMYPFRTTKMLKIAFKAMKARKDMVAVPGSTKRVLCILPYERGG